MKISNVNIQDGLILAPMAGVTDRAFRIICKKHKAVLTISEMVSAKALSFGDKKSRKLLMRHESETPYSVQIFGSDPAIMAEGANIVHSLTGCDLIDINMGCPAPKITSNGEGSALMRDIKTAERVIMQTVKASPVPITVKFRKGFTQDNINFIEFGKMAEASGASAITLHGRTRPQMYSGKADWQAIYELKNTVNIPVIANGDIFTLQDAIDIKNQTGADGIMAGRGSMGNPWLFERCYNHFNGIQLPENPTPSQKIDIAKEQIYLAGQDKGEKIAMLEARKHFIWYLKGLAVKHFKTQISSLQTYSDMENLSYLLNEHFEKLAESEVEHASIL